MGGRLLLVFVVVLMMLLTYRTFASTHKTDRKTTDVIIHKNEGGSVFLVESQICTILVNRERVFVYASIPYVFCDGKYSNAFEIHRDGTFLLRCVPTIDDVVSQLPERVDLSLMRKFDNAIDLFNFLYVDLREVNVG